MTAARLYGPFRRHEGPGGHIGVIGALMETFWPFFLAAISLLVLCQGGCAGGDEGRFLVVAFSSDLAGSGLEEAAASFAKARGIRVEVRSVSDDEVLDLLRFGECDVAVSHHGDGLDRLVSWNYVTGKTEVMKDEFILVGPPSDPAGLEGVESLAEAWKRLAETGSVFLVRQDGSGAAHFVASLVSGIEVPGRGELMLPVKGDEAELIRRAAEKGGYALVMKRYYEASPEGLKAFFRDGNSLKDAYFAVAVNPEVYPDVEAELAMSFVDYLASEEGQSKLSPSLRLSP